MLEFVFLTSMQVIEQLFCNTLCKFTVYIKHFRLNRQHKHCPNIHCWSRKKTKGYTLQTQSIRNRFILKTESMWCFLEKSRKYTAYTSVYPHYTPAHADLLHFCCNFGGINPRIFHGWTDELYHAHLYLYLVYTFPRLQLLFTQIQLMRKS